MASGSSHKDAAGWAHKWEMKRDFMLININEWIENQHLFENISSTGAQVWFIMIIAGVTAITNLRKPLFHVASLQEGLNWLPEEVRGGAFTPTCRYVLYYCPAIGGVGAIPLVCACCGCLSLLGLLSQELKPAVKILPCLLPSLKIYPSVPLPPNSVSYSVDTTHFFQTALATR